MILAWFCRFNTLTKQYYSALMYRIDIKKIEIYAAYLWWRALYNENINIYFKW